MHKGKGNNFKPEFYHWTSDNARQKIRKLKKNISYQYTKTHKHSVSIGFIYCFGFFMNILIANLLMQFFNITNCTMCLSKTILY